MDSTLDLGGDWNAIRNDYPLLSDANFQALLQDTYPDFDSSEQTDLQQHVPHDSNHNLIPKPAAGERATLLQHTYPDFNSSEQTNLQQHGPYDSIHNLIRKPAAEERATMVVNSNASIPVSSLPDKQRSSLESVSKTVEALEKYQPCRRKKVRYDLTACREVQQIKDDLNKVIETLRPWTVGINRIVGNFVEERCATLSTEDKEALHRWEAFVERVAPSGQ